MLSQRNRLMLALLFLALTVGAVVLSSGALGAAALLRLLAWVLCGGAVVAFTAALGVTPWFVLLDDYNRGNLQNLISYVWFVLLSSALMAGAFLNAFVWRPGVDTVQLFVRIDASIWVLAGIVLGGFTLNRVVEMTHATAPPPPAPAGVTLESWTARTTHVGRMCVRPSPFKTEANDRETTAKPATDASTTFELLADTVKGRQVGEQDRAEIGAVQQLLLQATTALGYLVALGMVLHQTPWGTAITELPRLPTELLTLLGVSTVGQSAIASVPAKPPVRPV